MRLKNQRVSLLWMRCEFICALKIIARYQYYSYVLFICLCDCVVCMYVYVCTNHDGLVMIRRRSVLLGNELELWNELVLFPWGWEAIQIAILFAVVLQMILFRIQDVCEQHKVLNGVEQRDRSNILDKWMFVPIVMWVTYVIVTNWFIFSSYLFFSV